VRFKDAVHRSRTPAFVHTTGRLGFVIMGAGEDLDCDGNFTRKTSGSRCDLWDGEFLRTPMFIRTHFYEIQLLSMSVDGNVFASWNRSFTIVDSGWTGVSLETQAYFNVWADLVTQ
jgi:hypothetical protein